jgi:murein DD-endopeptidase MepM/ murein hydrolase activator NlpD
MAAQDGTVILAGKKYNGYGNMVDILHKDGTVTRYAHGLRILVKAGQTVQQGEAIMYVGTSGLTRTPHVRFEVMARGEVLDPLKFLP